MSSPGDADTRRLSADALAAGRPSDWFEQLYAEADAGTATVPWDREMATPLLADWLAGRDGSGVRAVVVGCGYGRDSEHLAGLGFDTTAFDISATAIAGARTRHPDSPVDYAVADLFDLPAGWRGAFELVVESNNVQALPRDVRAAATAAVASLLAPGGTLVVISFVGDGNEDGPPWPFTRAELDLYVAAGVRLDSVEAVGDEGDRRWLVVYGR